MKSSVPRLVLAGVLSSLIAFVSLWAFDLELMHILATGVAYALAVWLCFLKVIPNRKLSRLAALMIVASLAYYTGLYIIFNGFGPLGSFTAFDFGVTGLLGASITALGLVHILSVPDRLRVGAVFTAAGAVGGAFACMSTVGAKSNVLLPLSIDLWLFTPWQVLTLAALSPTLARLEREAALRRSEPHCKKCDYNLTGNVSGVCPECGTPVELPL